MLQCRNITQDRCEKVQHNVNVTVSKHVETLMLLLGMQESPENHSYVKGFIQHATNLFKKTTVMKDFWVAYTNKST